MLLEWNLLTEGGGMHVRKDIGSRRRVLYDDRHFCLEVGLGNMIIIISSNPGGWLYS